jgi:hypothetical protein
MIKFTPLPKQYTHFWTLLLVKRTHEGTHTVCTKNRTLLKPTFPLKRYGIDVKTEYGNSTDSSDTGVGE